MLNTELSFEQIKQLFYTWTLTSGIKIILIILAIVAATKFVSAGTKKFLNLNIKTGINPEYDKKINTLSSILKSLINAVIVVVGLMLILPELGVNIGPILAAAGVLGVAVGFGSQRLIEDIISGFIILINDQIRVGDVVKIGDQSGFVEKITLNMVVLRDLSGNVHFIRNGQVNSIINMTKDFSYYVSDIGINYKEDIPKAIEAIKDADKELRQDTAFSKDILEPIEILGLDKFDNSTLIIKTRIKTKPIKQWLIGREFNLRLKEKFDKLNIEVSIAQKILSI